MGGVIQRIQPPPFLSWGSRVFILQARSGHLRGGARRLWTDLLPEALGPPAAGVSRPDWQLRKRHGGRRCDFLPVFHISSTFISTTEQLFARKDSGAGAVLVVVLLDLFLFSNLIPALGSSAEKFGDLTRAAHICPGGRRRRGALVPPEDGRGNADVSRCVFDGACLCFACEITPLWTRVNPRLLQPQSAYVFQEIEIARTQRAYHHAWSESAGISASLSTPLSCCPSLRSFLRSFLPSPFIPP